MLYDNIFLIGTSWQGYIAGTADGIVTVNGSPARRDIVVFNAQDLSVVQHSQSLESGHYLLNGLDSSKQYLMMVRDYNKEYEPFAYDYITPATDLTVAEQQQLWQSWQI